MKKFWTNTLYCIAALLFVVGVSVFTTYNGLVGVLIVAIALFIGCVTIAVNEKKEKERVDECISKVRIGMSKSATFSVLGNDYTTHTVSVDGCEEFTWTIGKYTILVVLKNGFVIKHSFKK